MILDQLDHDNYFYATDKEETSTFVASAEKNQQCKKV